MIAVREGSANSSTRVGTDSPNASGTSSSGGSFAGPVERLLQVNFIAEQCFKRQRNLKRNKVPLEESCLAEAKIIRINLRDCHTRQLEDDDHTWVVGARVVL